MKAVGFPRSALAAKAREVVASQGFLVTMLTVVMFVGFGLLQPSFFNKQFVVLPMLRDASVFTVVGLAQMAVLSIGHMNVAVGRMAAAGAMVTGATFQFLNLPFLLGVAVGVAAGALLGLFAGFIIVKSNVNSFVVTLAMDFALLGLVTMVYTSTTEAGAFAAVPAEMKTWRTGTFRALCLGQVCGPDFLPVMVVPAAIAVLLVYFLYRRSRLGRETLATGSNYRAALLSGIEADHRVMLAHGMSGGLAALGGIMLAATTGSFSGAIGTEFMIPSFLSPVLGGTLMSGGVAAVLGTVAGTMLTTVIRMGLTVMGAGLEVLNIALGLILLVALSSQRIRRGRIFRTERVSKAKGASHEAD